MNVTLSDRDLATILAALRYWQDEMSPHPDAASREHFADGMHPLTVVEIDALCERLNCTENPERRKP